MSDQDLYVELVGDFELKDVSEFRALTKERAQEVAKGFGLAKEGKLMKLHNSGQGSLDEARIKALVADGVRDGLQQARKRRAAEQGGPTKLKFSAGSGSTWNRVKTFSNLIEEGADMRDEVLAEAGIEPRDYESFQWDRGLTEQFQAKKRPDNQTNSGYLDYLSGYKQVAGLVDGNASAGCLSYTDGEQYSINGQSDVLLVDKSYSNTENELGGILVGLELMKDEEAEGPAKKAKVRQGKIELIGADLRSDFPPVIIVSDLGEVSVFLWLEAKEGFGGVVRSAEVSKPYVPALVEAIVKGEDGQLPVGSRVKLKMALKWAPLRPVKEDDDEDEEEEEDEQEKKARRQDPKARSPKPPSRRKDKSPANHPKSRGGGPNDAVLVASWKMNPEDFGVELDWTDEEYDYYTKEVGRQLVQRLQLSALIKVGN